MTLRTSESGTGTGPRALSAVFIFHSPEKFGLFSAAAAKLQAARIQIAAFTRDLQCRIFLECGAGSLAPYAPRWSRSVPVQSDGERWRTKVDQGWRQRGSVPQSLRQVDLATAPRYCTPGLSGNPCESHWLIERRRRAQPGCPARAE